MYEKGEWTFDPNLPDSDQRIKRLTFNAITALTREGRLETRFNTGFFTWGDSSQPESAGILGALVGSFWTMLVTLILAFPIGVAAAVYLEEFAPKNRYTDMIEVNINNLAAVPSIVFGLLGLAVFLGFFGLTRSTPLVGGMVLALMTLPRIIIPARAALKAVPPSVREAALGVGASKVQTVTHHVLPLAMPGILTGTIIRHGPGAGRDRAALDDRHERICRRRARRASPTAPWPCRRRSSCGRTKLNGDSRRRRPPPSSSFWCSSYS